MSKLNPLGWITFFIMFSAALITFYALAYISYNKFRSEETVIYKGPAKIMGDFYIPQEVIKGSKGTLKTIPEKHGLILKTNLLSARLEMTEAEKIRNKNKETIDVLVILKEGYDISFNKEVQLYFEKDNNKYKLGDEYNE